MNALLKHTLASIASVELQNRSSTTASAKRCTCIVHLKLEQQIRYMPEQYEAALHPDCVH